MAKIYNFKGFHPAAQLTNKVERNRVKLDDIGPEDAVLGELLAYWRSLRGPDKVPPPRTALDLQKLKSVMGWTHIIDCSADDPEAFRFRLFGSKADNLFGHDHPKDLTNMALGDFPCPVLGEAIMADYNTTKTSGCPPFHLIRARIGFRPTAYTRLVLPLTNDQGRTTQLLIAVNRRPLPELGRLSWD